ncbi:MAG: hypothetical protein OIF56_05310 [Cohaesibacter sp.]|nr:hypothetical protein [Cohaesibacter sp.]
MRAPFTRFALLSLILPFAGCMAQMSESPERWVETTKMRMPTEKRLYICHGFGCKMNYAFQPNAQDLEAVTQIMQHGKATAEAEREALGKAIQYFETRLGPLIGSDEDKGGLDLTSSGIAGQMDCIDEASNSTSYLLYLQMHSLLLHHSVSSPVARGFFLDGRYPHATSVVRQKQDKRHYAIDSWVKDNGVFPVIMPLETWFQEKPAGLRGAYTNGMKD